MRKLNIRRHYIHTTTKNAAIALSMAQQVWDREGTRSCAGIQELVYIINTTSLALQRVCDAAQYEYNTKES